MFETSKGGPTGEVWLTVPQADFSALDGPGPIRSLSPNEGARMAAAGAELFETWDTSATSVVQDLSYGLPSLQR